MFVCELYDEIAQIFTDTEMSRIKKAWVLQINSWDFPGGPVVKNPPPNAGDSGSIPDWGRSHVPRGRWARAPQLLSLHTYSPRAAMRSLHSSMRSLCAAISLRAAMRSLHSAMRSLRAAMKSSRSAQPGKDCAQQQRPSAAKNKEINIKKN